MVECLALRMYGLERLLVYSTAGFLCTTPTGFLDDAGLLAVPLLGGMSPFTKPCGDDVGSIELVKVLLERTRACILHMADAPHPASPLGVHN
eukprot:2945136-Amphidinium_carterae.1